MTVLLLIFLAVPLITVVVFSFNNSPIPGLPFRGLTAVWYGRLLASGYFHRVLDTSLVIAGLAVTGAMALGVPAAFALRRRFRLSGLLTALVFAPVAVPGVVIGVALLSALDYTNILAGVAPTVAAHILLVSPFIVLVVRSRLLGIDRRIEEAARDLGAGRMRLLRTIMMPLLATALLGAGILAVAISLDELVVTNFTIGSSATIPVWVFSQARTGLTPSINAIAVLLMGASLLLLGLAALVTRLRSASRLSEILAEER
jgi:ABC-type spermidine/putrescine transport system permease subunit II